MKKRTNVTLMLAFFMIFLLAVSGCGLAPKEEVLPDAPVLPTAAIKSYKKATVMRGDIIQRVKVECIYKAFRTEELKFGVEGKRLAHVYFEEGDRVKAGDLLADLEMSDLTEQIKYRTENIESINMQITNEKEMLELVVSNYSRLINIEGFTPQMASRYEAEIARHEEIIKELEEDLYFEQQRLETLNEEVRKHQIFAGIDGVILKIKQFGWRDVSNTKDTVITVYDPDTMVFVTSGKNPELFNTGDELAVIAGRNEYRAVVIDSAELDEEYTANADSGVRYLRIIDNKNQPLIDTWGEITFTLKELKDVLYLPLTAVHSDNGKSIVYVEDEGGIKSIKEIQTGFVADKKVEILSGLNEGDTVILE